MEIGFRVAVLNVMSGAGDPEVVAVSGRVIVGASFVGITKMLSVALALWLVTATVIRDIVLETHRPAVIKVGLVIDIDLSNSRSCSSYGVVHG